MQRGSCWFAVGANMRLRESRKSAKCHWTSTNHSFCPFPKAFCTAENRKLLLHLTYFYVTTRSIYTSFSSSFKKGKKLNPALTYPDFWENEVAYAYMINDPIRGDIEPNSSTRTRKLFDQQLDSNSFWQSSRLSSSYLFKLVSRAQVPNYCTRSSMSLIEYFYNIYIILYIYYCEMSIDSIEFD